MDTNQYKDYVLVMLFVKYVSDKYADQPFASINTPPGASFRDMVTLKGKPTIGYDINKKIIALLVDAKLAKYWNTKQCMVQNLLASTVLLKILSEKEPI
ncbi:hypothetical protein W03_07220 [Nitrosomonas sp. PY1]|uniref:hypothetical protein n=1 Tax=Nitrosomonas sp. PY1 TaxID=1803906 RepID=UPI001FC83123|nr:hypothetical protein [Nitrosomonas sp. PY1]GKS68718.1 hypothetical protein W03_07220 [Nitrosomonas sp. PY1]